MVDVDTGYVGVVVVAGKEESRQLHGEMDSFICVPVDGQRKRRLRHDNEPAMRQLAERTAAFRKPRSTILDPIIHAEHQSVRGAEGAHPSVQTAVRALRTDISARTGEDIVPGHTLFPWMLGHAAWAHNHFQPRTHRGGTPREPERARATTVLAPFRGGTHDQNSSRLFAIDARCAVDERNMGWEAQREHPALASHRTNSAKARRKSPYPARSGGKAKSRVQDPALSQAELLKGIPASVPTGLACETDTGQLAEEQDSENGKDRGRGGLAEITGASPSTRGRQRQGCGTTTAWGTIGYDPWQKQPAMRQAT